MAFADSELEWGQLWINVGLGMLELHRLKDHPSSGPQALGVQRGTYPWPQADGAALVPTGNGNELVHLHQAGALQGTDDFFGHFSNGKSIISLGNL